MKHSTLYKRIHRHAYVMLQVETQGAERREELHNRVQAMLKNHAIGSKKRRKDEMHRNALLARLETDAALLIRKNPSPRDLRLTPYCLCVRTRSLTLTL